MKKNFLSHRIRTTWDTEKGNIFHFIATIMMKNISEICDRIWKIFNSNEMKMKNCVKKILL